MEKLRVLNYSTIISSNVILSHQIAEYIDLVFSFKLNGNFNSSYYNFLSSEGTYIAFMRGINFKI